MGSVPLPAKAFVVLCRRIFNVISTFSISNQYLLQHAQSPVAHEETEQVVRNELVQEKDKDKSRYTTDWPWWMFRESWSQPWLIQTPEQVQIHAAEVITPAKSPPMPRLELGFGRGSGQGWDWHAHSNRPASTHLRLFSRSRPAADSQEPPHSPLNSSPASPEPSSPIALSTSGSSSSSSMPSRNETPVEPHNEPRTKTPKDSAQTQVPEQSPHRNTNESESQHSDSDPKTDSESKTNLGPNPGTESDTTVRDTIHQLLVNPALYDPLRIPRNPIVLCHGLYGFDTRGPTSFPSMRMHYWSNALNVLRDRMGAEVIVTSVPSTGSISSRAQALDAHLQSKLSARNGNGKHIQDLNFLAHSMGGLDCRHLISHVIPQAEGKREYKPVSLMTVSTPHRGSPFMDWCSENLGLGKLAREEKELLAKASSSSHSTPSPSPSSSQSESNSSSSSFSLNSLPSSFTTLLLSVLDSPAYANLTSRHLNEVFNPATPDDPSVKYFSVAGKKPGVNIWHPLWLPKMVLDDWEEKERKNMRTEWETRYGAYNPTLEARADQGRYPTELDYDSNDANYKPLWARDEEWGNDCLVTVQSAKWGEFLGVMDGCDHWEMRGARGIEFGVDLPGIPAIGLGTSFGSSVSDGSSNQDRDGWSLGGLRDLGWFLKAWRTEEKVQQEAAKRVSETVSSSSSNSSFSESRQTSSPKDRETQQRDRDRARANDDAVIKASTDKLSAVFDWVTERVPSTPLPLLGGKGGESGQKATDSGGSDLNSIKGSPSKELLMGLGTVRKEATHTTLNTNTSAKKSELESKEDLERFYVGLMRRLYDEGL